MKTCIKRGNEPSKRYQQDEYEEEEDTTDNM
jgi:hypothetical protein